MEKLRTSEIPGSSDSLPGFFVSLGQPDNPAVHDPAGAGWRRISVLPDRGLQEILRRVDLYCTDGIAGLTVTGPDTPTGAGM